MLYDRIGAYIRQDERREYKMTAVLEKLVYEEVCPREIVDWLTQKQSISASPKNKHCKLTAFNSLRSSFVQFFINHLRSQTAQLTFHGQTALASPAGKANKLFKALQQQTSKPVARPHSGSRKSKVNLFQSPASSDFSDLSVLETSNSSIDTSTSIFESRTRRGDVKHVSNKSNSSVDSELQSSKSFERLSKPAGSRFDRKPKKSRSYNTHKTSTDWSRSKGSNRSGPSSIHDFSLDSLQDFPGIGSNSSLTSTPRRITPTAVSTPLSTSKQRPSFGDEQSPWPQTSPGNLGSVLSNSGRVSLEDERDLLKMLKSGKTKQIAISSRFSPQSPGEKAKSISVCDVDAVVPEMNKVTFAEQLELVIELYSIMLEELLIPNLWMEIYFLFQLLTVKGAVSETRCYDYCYLSTVHNAVYFTVVVLSKLSRYLALLDKATLKLLLDNDAIQRFKPGFHRQLILLWEKSSVSSYSNSKPNSMLAGVPFHVETDNRENFPTDRSFHCFKKQRDKFYELLREWQVQHTIPGWSMHASMATRIRELVAMATDITNIFHFAKLFTSQLIKMCLEDPDQVTGPHENFLLNHLKMENPDKLKRLEERFTTPSSVVGPCPPPQFPGCQEFFRKFILEADSYTFNQHLMDCISARIQELNKFSYLPDQGITSSASFPDKELKDQFLACLQTVQILAKFLGLIKFLPYKQNEKVSEKLKEEIMAGRPKEPYQLDILSCLRAGYQHKRLVLVVPWLIEYLSMIDSDAVTLDYYKSTFRLLSSIYRVVGTSNVGKFPPCNQFLLLLLIGWLFEVLSQTPDLLNTLESTQLSESSEFTEPPLDHIPFIEQPYLYTTCPYLSDARGLLSEASVSSPMRKITPVAADVTVPSSHNYTTEFNVSQVQIDLERNFFHTQSPSLKKSVDFVSNRVASNCIKHIDGRLLMAKRKQLADRMMAMFQNASTTEGDLGGFRKEAQDCTDQICKETLLAADDSAKRFVEKKCKVLIRNMVADDASVQLQQTACSIAVRNSLQKVQRWIHLQIPGAFRQELESTLQKCLKLQTTKAGHSTEMKIKGEETAGIVSTTPPSVLLQELKDAVYALMFSPDPSQLSQDLHSLITKTKTVLGGRQDLTPTTISAIGHLLKDLFALTCIIHPHCVTTPPLDIEPFEQITDKFNSVNISSSGGTHSVPVQYRNGRDTRETSRSNASQENTEYHTIQCSVKDCRYEVSITFNTKDRKHCLFHEFLILCKEYINFKLSPHNFISARTQYISALGNSVTTEFDFCQIYNYMKEIQLIDDDEVT